MGSLELHDEPVALADLARCSHIALVRPDEPALRLEDRTVGGTGPKPSVMVPYRIGFERLVVELWLRGTGPKNLEIALPTNEAAFRDAKDQSRGRLGQVDHRVIVHKLQGDGTYLLRRAGPRIVFLRVAEDDTFTEAYPGVGLSPEGIPAVVAAIPSPPPEDRRPVIALGIVSLALVTIGALLVMSQL